MDWEIKGGSSNFLWNKPVIHGIVPTICGLLYTVQRDAPQSCLVHKPKLWVYLLVMSNKVTNNLFGGSSHLQTGNRGDRKSPFVAYPRWSSSKHRWAEHHHPIGGWNFPGNASSKVEQKVKNIWKPQTRHVKTPNSRFPPEMVVKPEHGQCVVNRSRATVGSDLSENDARMTQRTAIPLVPERGTHDHHTSI